MSTKKLSIFVEGHTESLFVQKFVEEFFKHNRYSISSYICSDKCPRIVTLIGKLVSSDSDEYQILIYNSCTDNRVLSDVIDQYDSLKKNGCSYFLAIRDLYPDYTYSEKSNAYDNINKFLMGKPEIKFIFAAMEIETWFLSEITHFSRISSLLTLDSIRSVIDLENINNFEEYIHNPAEVLHDIYSIASFSYKKKLKQVERTIKSLDYEKLSTESINKTNSLKEFVTYLESFR